MSDSSRERKQAESLRLLNAKLKHFDESLTSTFEAYLNSSVLGPKTVSA